MRFGWLRLTASEGRREGAGGDGAEGGTLGETRCYATDKHGGGEVCEWGGLDKDVVVLGIASAQSPAAVTERARPTPDPAKSRGQNKSWPTTTLTSTLSLFLFDHSPSMSFCRRAYRKLLR